MWTRILTPGKTLHKHAARPVVIGALTENLFYNAGISVCASLKQASVSLIRSHSLFHFPAAQTENYLRLEWEETPLLGVLSSSDKRAKQLWCAFHYSWIIYVFQRGLPKFWAVHGSNGGSSCLIYNLQDCSHLNGSFYTLCSQWTGRR